jgi:hypothetical protein
MKIPSQSRFTSFVRLAARTLLLELGARAPMLAQDNGAAGEPIVATIDPAKLAFDFLVDGRLAQDDPANRKFKTLQAAYAAAPAGTPEKPTVIGIAPNVYQIPAAAGATTGLTITKNYLTLLGLTNNRRSVVFADNRGNRMGGGESGGSANGYVKTEDAIVKRIRHIGQQALARWAEERRATAQPVTTGELRPAGKKNRWQTTLGWIELTEQLWRSGTQTPRPFCQADRIRNRGSSRRWKRAMTDFGADESFASAAEKVQAH